jgi:hypothetical protein
MIRWVAGFMELPSGLPFGPGSTEPGAAIAI